MRINHLEKVQVNDSEQWVLVRGNSNGPLIIQVQAGPGFPMIPEANSMQRKLGWEDQFLIAYWDQRGCGKSYKKDTDPRTMHFAQLAEDVLVMAEFMVKKYRKQKAILIGYSLGATTSLMAVSKNSSLFSHLFLVGIDIDVPAANRHVMEFALEKASERKDGKAIKEINQLARLSITNSKLFQRRAKVITNLGGIIVNTNYNKLMLSSLGNMLFSREYKLTDIPKTIKGMNFCQDALLPEMDSLYLFDHQISINIPIHFMQGMKDAIAPSHIAKKYYDFLPAKQKTFHPFENAAHLPHIEEPGKFMEVIRENVR